MTVPMRRQRILLYLAFPGCGILATLIAGVPGGHSGIILHINIVPTIIMLFFAVLDDAYRNGPLSLPVIGPILMMLVLVMANAAMWLPVAHYVGRFLERRRKWMARVR